MSKIKNKLLKKLHDSASKTRRTGSGRCSVCVLMRRQFLQGTVGTYKPRCLGVYEPDVLGMYVCLFQISWRVFLPKIIRIGQNLTKISQR